MDKYDALRLLLVELERAEQKFPDWPEDVVHAASIMAEEAGEAMQAANNLKWHGGSKEKLREEFVQTGAMCLRNLINMEG